MDIKAKIFSALTAGILTVMIFMWILPQAVNKAEIKTNAYAADSFEAPAIVIGAANGMPGETVVIPVSVYCNNDLS